MCLIRDSVRASRERSAFDGARNTSPTRSANITVSRSPGERLISRFFHHSRAALAPVPTKPNAPKATSSPAQMGQFFGSSNLSVWLKPTATHPAQIALPTALAATCCPTPAINPSASLAPASAPAVPDPSVRMLYYLSASSNRKALPCARLHLSLTKNQPRQASVDRCL